MSAAHTNTVVILIIQYNQEKKHQGALAAEAEAQGSTSCRSTREHQLPKQKHKGALISSVTRAGVKVKASIDSVGQTIIADSWAFNRLSNEFNEAAIEGQGLLLAGNYSFGDAAFQRRNGDGERDGLLSQEWDASIAFKWNSTSVEAKT